MLGDVPVDVNEFACADFGIGELWSTLGRYSHQHTDGHQKDTTEVSRVDEMTSLPNAMPAAMQPRSLRWLIDSGTRYHLIGKMTIKSEGLEQYVYPNPKYPPKLMWTADGIKRSEYAIRLYIADLDFEIECELLPLLSLIHI